MTTRNNLPLAAVYRHLEPGPVVLLTTAQRGRANVMPMSWLTMMEFEPPLIGAVVSNANYSFRALRATGECVINIPTVEIIRATVACGNCSGRTVDKFAKYKLTPLPASQVQAPLIAECPINLECRVVDSGFVRKYNLFVLEVVKAWTTGRRRTETFHHMGMGKFVVDGRVIRMVSGKK